MNEEAIKLLKGYCEWCTAQGGDCQANLDGCNIFDVIALLQPLAGKQPEPEEFTKELRCYLEERISHAEEQLKYAKDNEGALHDINKDFWEDELAARKKELKACDIIDRQAQEKAEAVAARVQAENECCVLRGENEKLRGALRKYGKHQQECPRSIPSYIPELDKCTCSLDQALKENEDD